MHYLIVSPTPLFPTTAGNRAGIRGMVRQIRAAGHRVSFLYSIQEEISNKATLDTLRQVDAYYLCSYDMARRREAAIRAVGGALPEIATFNYELDSWYDEDVGAFVKLIYERDPFDVIVGNYIWMSKAFEIVPPQVIKIQHTHDAFSDRMFKLSRPGFSPGFFSVSPEDEARGLDRADINIAVQYAEEFSFRALTDKAVFTLQFAPEEMPFLPVNQPMGRKLRVGFVGGNNNTNVRTLVSLVEYLVKTPGVSEHIELCVAGAVYMNFAKEMPPFVIMLGVCENIHDFYKVMDVMVNPMDDGTGLKIKSVEALQYHRPIVMTRIGSEGLLSPYHFHRCKSTLDVIGYLKMILDNPRLLFLLQAAGEKVLNAYRCRLAEAENILTAPQKFLSERAERLAEMRCVSCRGREFSLAIRAASPAPDFHLPDDEEWERIGSLVPAQSVWLDVGSRAGAFALFAAHICQADKIILVEFDPDYIEQIKQNVIGNRMQHIVDMRLLGYAAGAAPGYGALEAGQERSVAVFSDDADLVPEATVPFVQLDQFLDEEPRLDACRIDAANPLDVLSGLAGILKKFRPILFVQTPRGEDGKLESWAQENGYAFAAQRVDEKSGAMLILAPTSRTTDAVT
ncbi:MAG: FkbM family methyltransferase [Alphaproteobacteria bacterium]|nr:FkbM family methyltransferase [Alphaproteobacteria bacterium]